MLWWTLRSLINQLENPQNWEEVIPRLVTIGAPATDSLLEALGHNSGNVRAASAVALGSIGDPRSAEPLRTMAVHDPLPNVRRAAALQLGRFIDDRTISVLIACLEDTDAQLAEIAKAQLCAIKSDSLVNTLMTLVESGHQKSQLIAAEILGQIGDARAVDVLISALAPRSESRMVANAAALALARIGEPRALQPLVAALEEGVADAAWGVGRLAGPNATEFFIALLAVKPKSVLTDVRPTVVDVLGALGDPRAVVPLLSTLHRAEWSYANHVEQALVKIGLPSTKDLVAALESSEEEERRVAAQVLTKLDWKPENSTERILRMVALRKYDDVAKEGELGIPFLVKALTKYGDANASYAMGSMGVSAVPALLELLQADVGMRRVKSSYSDSAMEGSSVKSLVVVALGRIGAPAIPFLTPLFNSSISELQSLVIEALSRMGEPAVPALAAAADLREHREHIIFKLSEIKGSAGRIDDPRLRAEVTFQVLFSDFNVWNGYHDYGKTRDHELAGRMERAIQRVTTLLENSAKYLRSDQLERVAAVEGAHVKFGGCLQEDPYTVKEFDSQRMRQLARQELARRSATQ